MGEVVPSQTARLTMARLRMTEVIAAVPEKDDGSASAHVVPVSAPGVACDRFVPDSPLEKPNSLASWENTGNIVRRGLRVRLLAWNPGTNTKAYDPIPYAAEQGIYFGLAGN